MEKSEELELKTLVNKQQFEDLLSFYPGLEFEKQVNHYFYSNDTSHYAFRIREKNHQQLFTLKQYQKGKVFEYEKYFIGKLQDDQDILNTLASFNLFPPFKELATLTTKRAIYTNQYAELCFDINAYNGTTDYEIEYEVKQPHDYLKTFSDILAKANITYVPSWGSKYKRCLKTLISIDEKNL